MSLETDDVRQNEVRSRELDAFDRKLLSLLVEDATRSYARDGRAGRACRRRRFMNGSSG